MEWSLAQGVSDWDCPSHEEMALYVGFEGTTHVVGGLGYFIVNTCKHAPQSVDVIQSKAEAHYEIDEGVDLRSAINSTVRQLHELGILAPCLTPS